ncbi:MAG: hypothetical protein OT477_14830 [Chloroflexi bacterium]|nr:hypothetical protein [Chloroflexota bacterium]
MEEKAPYTTKALPANFEFHECPIAGIDGGIVVEKFISAPDHLKWYQAIAEEVEPDKSRPATYQTFQDTRHMIKKIEMPAYPAEMWDAKTPTIPAILVRWAVYVVSKKIKEANDPNAFAGLLPSTTGTSE